MDLLGEDEPVRKLDKGKKKAKDQGDGITINSSFAEKYEQKKRGEELSKLKDKYGPDHEGSEDDSEDFSSEDSDAEFVTPAVDAAILRTISRIKRKDPSIYGNGKVFDDEEHLHAAGRNVKATGSSKRKAKPVFLQDFQRTALMATLGGDKEDLGPGITPADEAAQLRAETKRAFLGSGSSDGGDGSDPDDAEGLLVPRERTKDEVEADEEEYTAFLRQHVGDAEIEAALRREGEDDDAFLREYILGRGWLDKESKKVPKYSDVVGGEDERDTGRPTGANAFALDSDLDEEDALHEEKADAFESKYNFRFETEEGANLVTHARDSGTTARRQDESRAQARAAVKARKADEKRAKVDELARLKDLKREEILEKLARVRKNAGDDEFALEGFDFESEFDPEEHDRRMDKAFDEGYYGREDADGKPVWDDDIDLGDIEDAFADETAYEPGGDAYDPLEPAGKMSKRQKQREKKKSKKSKVVDEALNGDQMTAEEQKASLGQALDEYKKLDFEDIVGDLPTRFKYTKVEPDMFDLTPAEILMSTDAELNDVLGLRKLAPYREKGNGKPGKAKKKQLQELRERLAKRKWGEEVDGEVEAGAGKRRKGSARVEGQANGEGKKRKGKKERQRAKQDQEAAVVAAEGD